MSISWVVRFAIISCWMSCSTSEDAYLRCDGWDKGAYHDERSAYCTITDFHVTEAQNVVIDDGGGPQFALFLKFYDSSLLHIHPVIFNKFVRLTNLDVSDSGIQDISRNTFTSASNLSWVNVSHNEISMIAGAVFQGAESLRDLDLSHNRIQSLNEFSFHGLKSLAFLDLSANSIVDLHKNIFSDNSLIENVVLRDNRIDSLNTGVFSRLTRLTTVNLAANDLTQLDPDVFKGAPGISRIILSKNLLRQLHLNVGYALKTLYADENKLASLYINVSRPELAYLSNVTNIPLQQLSLSRNKLSDLRNITELSSLVELALSHNHVGQLNISTFQKQKHLEKLVLRNCSLSGLTYGTFRGQTNLEYLDLSENQLNHLNLDIFLPYMYRTLEELYIDSNNLSEIAGRHTFSAFSSLRKLGLDGNNFNCSYLLHLVSFPSFEQPVELITNGVEPIGPNIHGVACTYQEGSMKNSDFSNNTTFATKSISIKLYENTIGRLRLHEHQLEEHLLLMRVFVVIFAILCICVIIFKVIVYVKRSSGSWGNIISYRSTGEGLS